MSFSDAARHPAEYELAEYLDGTASADATAAVSAHIMECPACARLLSLAGPPVHAVPPKFASDPHRSSPAGPVVPDKILAALRERRVAAPAPGQVWRLRAPCADTGQQHAMLVAVLAADEDVLVAPVTADPQSDTDLWSVQLPLIGTDHHVAVWVALEASVGWETLDVLIAEVPAEALATVHRALRRGLEPPRGLELGRGIDDELRRRRDALHAQLADFSSARLWSDDESADDEAPASTVGSALTAAGLGLPETKALLGLTAKHARLVLEDAHPLTPAQLARVAEAVGTPVRNGGGVVSAGWVRALADPVLRPDFDAIADATAQDAWELRSEQVAFQPAARGNRGEDADYAELARDRVRALRREAGLE